MITYGFSLQGKSHVDTGTVCQDANKISRLQNGWYVAAVADGVGSAARSDIGSQLAVEKMIEYCEKTITGRPDFTEVKQMIEEAYEYALQGIRDYVEKCSGRIEEYDTTLSAVVYDGRRVAYGHAGDGGIMARLMDGRVVPLTERQKGMDGMSVRPLRAGASSWEFGICKKEVAALLLVTDGMLDGVFMPYLVNLVDCKDRIQLLNLKKNHVYVTAAQFFMNPDCVFKNRAIKEPENFIKRYVQGDVTKDDSNPFLSCLRHAYQHMFRSEEVEEICASVSKYQYPLLALKKVTDDKTVLCLMNEKAKVEKKEMEYFMEPDWKALQNRYEELAYPDKKQIRSTKNTEEDTKPSEKAEKNPLENLTHKSDFVKKNNAEKDSSQAKRGEDAYAVTNTPRLKKTLDVFVAITIIALVGTVILLATRLQGQQTVTSGISAGQNSYSDHIKEEKKWLEECVKDWDEGVLSEKEVEELTRMLTQLCKNRQLYQKLINKIGEEKKESQQKSVSTASPYVQTPEISTRKFQDNVR